MNETPQHYTQRILGYVQGSQSLVASSKGRWHWRSHGQIHVGNPGGDWNTLSRGWTSPDRAYVGSLAVRSFSIRRFPRGRLSELFRTGRHAERFLSSRLNWLPHRRSG